MKVEGAVIEYDSAPNLAAYERANGLEAPNSIDGILNPVDAPLFKEFDVTPGQGINLDAPSAVDGRSYITYAFKNEANEVVYIGRASGTGNPTQVLNQRIAKGHKHYNETLVPQVIDVQSTKLANQGAEEFFIQGYRQEGANLTNIDEALSFSSKQRSEKSVTKIEAYLEELTKRNNQ